MNDTPPRSVAATVLRVLCFQASRDEFRGLGNRHLLVGLVCTWLAGIGRYWDHPDPSPYQAAGLGSLAYVCVLAAILTASVAPLVRTPPTLLQTLAFVTLTSPPALLYAFPVERFCEPDTARTWNLWFLAVVALWRVLLLAR